jgi:hypothetical protein
MRSVGLLLVTVLLLGACGDDAAPAPDATPTPTPDAAPADAQAWFEIVGSTDLGGRGMNSALAVDGTPVYVGSRTDGVAHAGAGVKIVDVADPAHPTVTGQIGAPDEDLRGMSSRELRVVPSKHLLVVLNLQCSPDLHACTRDTTTYPTTGGAAEANNFKFYDISDPATPALVGTYPFPLASQAQPHEFFLWQDPLAPDRVLLYTSTPAGPPNLQVLDVTDPTMPVVLATWDPPFFTEAPAMFPRGSDYLHSMAVTRDGTRAFVSEYMAGVLELDTSQLADASAMLPTITTLTPTAGRFVYANVQTHSAVPVPGRPLVFTTDEIYKPPYGAGCPWGWVHIADFTDPAAPTAVAEAKLPQDVAGAGCTVSSDPAAPAPNFTAHNPTLTSHLALVSWHAGGVVVIDTTDAAAPRVIGAFQPTPRASVAVEDPSLGDAPVAMWSYPVIQDGLVYVVDIRNGLYILRYHGPCEQEIAGTTFREGNSNLGEAP